ncbi:26S proteasome non-ATPase regulatory subunit 9 [Chionoecetes opilio]|uniref:26S proteasome non-ATPase regulatory subunit 9 n=1 Tax=Chionoecetes opilio TaxID=41210 RepID=A0A8J5BUY9_CHIOP|nr:26S proteasome non-ATPase regulatory subunit 9 [Chionoecetes opilio]
MICTRESVMGLMQDKDRLEHTLKELWDVLKTNNVGLNEPLIDSEGYPRNDIDVYQVRHARHQIKCLQNDHTALLRRIEEGLAVVLSPSASSTFDPNGTSASTPAQTTEPFARVDRVIPGSPANMADLVPSLSIFRTLCLRSLPQGSEGDLLTKFGSVHAENFRSLTDVAQVVQHSVNSPVQVCVQRSEDSVSLALVPRQWSGRGLLGCNLLPYERLDRE